MRKSKKDNWVMTKEERQERWDKCTKYLRQYATLDGAQAAAHADGVSFDTSVWITAMDKMLQRGEFPGQGEPKPKKK